jgi:hypothetical protein
LWYALSSVVMAVRRLLGVCVFVFVATPVGARPEFPGIVQETLARLSPEVCPPPCVLCHTSSAPNKENVEQPFAVNLQKFKQPLDLPVTEETLPDFLDHMETDPCPNTGDPACSTTPCGVCNADGTGEADIAELRKNENPNNSGNIVCPKYGCGARVASPPLGRSLDGAALLVALAGAGVLARRRSSTAGSAG